MIRDNLILDLNEELLIDNFAGGGGASTGIELALGRHVDHAINHDRFALGMHRINHPQTVHHPEDVFDVNPAILCEGRRVGLGWFSPDCKHFSKAKGGKPLSKKIRGLAFVIFRWARYRTRVIYMENVEEIQTWGPLLHHPQHANDCTCMNPCGKADPAHKGRTWRAFLSVLTTGIDPNHLDLAEMIEVLTDKRDPSNSLTKEELVRRFGYDVAFRQIRACDYGAPTIRKRLFMIMRCDAMPIIWPDASHGSNLGLGSGVSKMGKKAETARGDSRPTKLKPHRIIAECIDWHLPVKSIFLNREQARLAKCRRPLAASTLKRIATGIDRYVLKAQKPFIVTLTHHGADRIEPCDQPMSTVTGAHRGEKSFVDATLAPIINRAAHSDESPSGVKRRGKGSECADKPIGTQPASNEFAIVAAHLTKFTTGSVGQSPDKPISTIMAGDHSPDTHGGAATVHGLVEAKIVPFITEHANASNQRNIPVDKPGPTICAEVKGGSFAIVSGTLVGAGGPSFSGKPKPVDKPIGTLVTQSHTHLAAASMVKMRGTNIGSPALEPIHTISAAGQHHGVSFAYLLRHFGKSVGQPVDAPAPTAVASGGGKSAVVTAEIAAYYGNDQDGQALDESARTVTTKERFGLSVNDMGVPPLTEKQIAGAQMVAQLLRDHGVQFDGEFATVGGYVIVDIGMRMLTARELFRAQGFLESYVIDRAWIVDPKTGEINEVKLTKEQQIRMCGNSVCPPCAEALVRANSSDLAIWSIRERKKRKRCWPVADSPVPIHS